MSKFIEMVLKPLVFTFKTYVKDDWNFLRELSWRIPFNSTMHSCDISSKLLLTYETRINSPMVHKWFYNWIAKICVKKHQFLFDDNMYLQILGTAMGEKICSPLCLSNCLLFRRDKTFRQQITKIFQWNWMQVNYEIIKTLYELWFCLFAAKLKLSIF